MALSSDEGMRVPARRALVAGAAGTGALALVHRLVDFPKQDRPRVDDSPWAANTLWMFDAGILNREETEHFSPDTALTRETAAVWLYRLAGSPSFPLPSTSPYRDVTENASHVAEILWLRGKGIAWGGFDATFRPTERITNAELCALLERMLAIPLARQREFLVQAPSALLRKVPASHRFFKALGWIDAVGLLPVLSNDGQVFPDRAVTQGACAALLRRVDGLFT